MSELQFPKDPVVGQQYDFPPYRYHWDGVKWKTMGIGYNPVNDLRDEVLPTTREAIRRSYAEAGLNLVDGSFEEGGTLTSTSDVLLHKASGIAYSWSGAFPKVVAAGSTPTPLGSGGWVDRSDVTLRSELTSGGSTIDDIANLPENFASSDYPAQNASVLRVVNKNLHIGNGDVVAPAAYRDAVLVSRGLNGLTDCHAFADRTIISGVTDSGTYGAFDATTKLMGSHTQSHLFAFQDRTTYGGSGSIGTWGNIIWPTHSGSGSVTYRANIQIKDIDITGGGTVGTNIGIEIQNLDSANSNSAITLLQNNGFSIYAPNAGAVQFGGTLRVDGTVTHKGTSLFEGNNFLGGPTKVGGYANGTPPQAGTALTVEKNGLPNQGFVDVNSLGLSIGNVGDYRVQIVSNAATRLKIGNLSENYAVAPGSDNAQPLGLSTARYSVVYAGTGTINTSDAREKTEPMPIDDAILDAWGDVQLITFQWLDSVIAKGESARWHFGVIAQQVRDAFLTHGIDGTKYGLLCYDEWEASDAVVEVVSEQRGDNPLDVVMREVEISPAISAGNRWGIRADQCLFLESAYQRRRADRIEARLDAAGL